MALFLALVFVIETETGAQFYDQSYALVIGIDRYRSPKWQALTYAVKDAQGMAQFLKQQGFHVTPLYNQQADRNAIIYQMQNVLAPRVKKGDRVLVFFAGHGYTERLADTDYGYIIPYDAAEYSNTYISMEELQTLSRKMGQAKHQLFIMDACYGGLLGVRSGGISENVPNYLDEITKRKARQILTAGGPNQQVVDEGSGGHSVFTGYLLKGLQEGVADHNNDGYITFAELLSYLVPAATNDYQTPAYSLLPGHESGEFTFRSPGGKTQQHDEVTDPSGVTRRGPEGPGGPRPPPPEFLTNDLGMKFAWIPAGEFQMGSTSGNDDERPVHTVRISRPFYLGIHEVTQGQWEAVMGNNPSHFRGNPDRPVETVSWEDVHKFIDKLNAMEGGTPYRLPTEAEWEYAARAGSNTAYTFGDDSSQLGMYAWFGGNAGNTTHPVETLQPNDWGLYHMHGNVWEWVQDWYGKYAAKTVTDPQGPASGSSRVLRGCGRRAAADRCRSAVRHHEVPSDRDDGVGFRLLRTAP